MQQFAIIAKVRAVPSADSSVIIDHLWTNSAWFHMADYNLNSLSQLLSLKDIRSLSNYYGTIEICMLSMSLF